VAQTILSVLLSLLRILTSAGPSPVLRPLNQAGRDWVLLDVSPDLHELDFVSYPMIERLVLPERLAGPVKGLIRLAGSDSLE
jgi:hypothetical protein